MQAKMAKALKNRASKHRYVSPAQLQMVGFDTPFVKELNPENRWVKLAQQIPWDNLVSVYSRQLNNSAKGANGINPRVAIGAIIIKHMCDLSDRETILQIQENVYMQYFIGYSSFSDEAPFDPSLFVDLRKRLGADEVNAINERIMGVLNSHQAKKDDDNSQQASDTDQTILNTEQEEQIQQSQEDVCCEPKHGGTLIVDATACPQDITYPTDLNLLNDAREKSEELIDILHSGLPTDKPRTYRHIARKEYLHTAQKKIKTKKQIRSALRKQLSYLKRNIKHIGLLLNAHQTIPLSKADYKYLLVIQTLYDQQKKMFDEKIHSIEHRIVSIHQPHVRPIVRGKTNAYVEFGAKIQVSLSNGIAFLDELSWDAFNEGTRLMNTIDRYKGRFGYYPEYVLADKIYCNRENRTKLKQLGIKLRAKPLGRPSLAVAVHLRPGERNPIEGKFGQAKTAYGLNRIKARLSQTSESWIASIIMVLNLINLIGRAPVSLLNHIASAIRDWILIYMIKMWRFQPRNTFKWSVT
jgi:transposase, IS5 family